MTMTLRRSDSLPTRLRAAPVPSDHNNSRPVEEIRDSCTVPNFSDTPAREQVIATWESLHTDVKKLKNGFTPKTDQPSCSEDKNDFVSQSIVPTFACQGRDGKKRISYDDRQAEVKPRASNRCTSFLLDTGQTSTMECGKNPAHRRRSLLQRLLSWRTPECDCRERFAPKNQPAPKLRPEDLLCTCGVRGNRIKLSNKCERGRSKSVGYEAAREVAQFRRCASAGATVGAETAAALRARAALTLARRYYPEGGWGWTITVVGTIVQVLSHGLQLGGGAGPIACTAAVKYHVSPLYTHDIQIPENYQVEDDYPILPDESLPSIPCDISLSSAQILCDPPPSLTCVEEIPKDDVESSEALQPASLEQNNTIPETSNEVPIELDPEIRLALGDPIEDSPKYGANIHDDLAQRWLPILKKGLTKDVKEKLLKEHHVPDNCRLLKSPSLNPEIAAAVAEMVRTRDKKMEMKQNQLGLGITAVSKAMEIIINDGNKIESIKLLSEGCRILTDLHHTETQIRTKCITPCLDKSILNIIQEEERDEFLFGSKLSEKIKAAKAIEKQGWQIKRNVPQKVNQNQSHTRARYTGNWAPPPRYPSSVSRGGGRGAYMTSRPHLTRQFRPQAPPPLPPATAQPQARTTTLSKQRAQTRQ